MRMGMVIGASSKQVPPAGRDLACSCDHNRRRKSPECVPLVAEVARLPGGSVLHERHSTSASEVWRLPQHNPSRFGPSLLRPLVATHPNGGNRGMRRAVLYQPPLML